ncbi:MAG: M28 family metallopeptidase [Bacteroidota bacterium]|nr:M28 family metallopeptidase [Bacteroidota bacterium]
MYKSSIIVLTIIYSALIFTSCDQEVKKEQAAVSTINEADLSRHIKNLASDEFQGRKPFTIGEEKTIEYIRNEFMNMGLKPANNGSYYQEVPMVEITGAPTQKMSIRGKGKKIDLNINTDFVAVSRHIKDKVSLRDSELVFAGYGIVAPEYGWNDYEGLDVKGKTVILLINDPGFTSGDSTFFKGKEMTYYGRWSYKYEEAARQGANGVLIVHDTEPASYPWQVVENGWTGSKLYLQDKNQNLHRTAIEGWISKESAGKIFAAAGYEYDFTQEATKRGFQSFSLGLSISLSIKNTFKNSKSYNVVSLYPGTDLASEHIVYTAHWDHLGIGAAVNGDTIYNGAIDNASGVAALLEIAEAFTKTKTRPLRSIVFLAVTAEEQGLLGSAYYAENPIFPLETTVANINMDALNALGKMKDLTIIGHGHSELDDYAFEIAKSQGRYIHPDPNPGTGSFFRSDHFNFAKAGVPALYAKGGYEHAEHGIAFAENMSKDFTSKHYHQPSDQYDPDNWDLSGMVEDVQLFFLVGKRIGEESYFPQWKEGSEFKSIREKGKIIAEPEPDTVTVY